jgi:uncharacterized protein (TIGR00369 family)
MERTSEAGTPERIARAKTLWNSRPLHEFFGMTLDALEPGYARCIMHSNEHNRGGVHGAAHGGVLAFLADVAALAAISTVLDPVEQASGTAELNISYLSPGVSDVIADARVLRKGRTLIVTDIDMTDRAGKLLSKSRVSYAVRPT